MGILGEAELFLRIWGAKANNFREKRKLFSGSWGDQCIIFRDLGSTYPPGGLITFSINKALEGFLGIQGYWSKTVRDTGYFSKRLKGYGILGSILGIWGYNTFSIFGIVAIFILGMWDIFQNN